VTGLAGLLTVGFAAAPAVAVRTASQPGVSENAVQLIQRVHQASLVEIWSGQRAQQVSPDPAVRWVGRSLLSDHVFLDRKVDEIAAQLGVSLPNQPTLQQQAGVRKMARETGAAFDRAFANSLYFGHDVVMKLIRANQDEVQRGGVNPQVRQFVDIAFTFVSKHMQWLEATGMVTASVSPSASLQSALARQTSGTTTYSNAIPAVVGLGSLAVLVFAVWSLLSRRPAPVPARNQRPAARVR
jgi:predicted outer membrane protein